MGPGITKVRSLKMDRKVWTEELIEVSAQNSPKSLVFFWGGEGGEVTPPSPPHGGSPHGGPTGCGTGTAGARRGVASLGVTLGGHLVWEGTPGSPLSPWSVDGWHPPGHDGEGKWHLCDRPTD